MRRTLIVSTATEKIVKSKHRGGFATLRSAAGCVKISTSLSEQLEMSPALSVITERNETNS